MSPNFLNFHLVKMEEPHIYKSLSEVWLSQKCTVNFNFLFLKSPSRNSQNDILYSISPLILLFSFKYYHFYFTINLKN